MKSWHGAEAVHQRAIPALAALALLGGALIGCSGNKWIEGRWLLIDREGKPGRCYDFAAKGAFRAFPNMTCTGSADPMLSGRYQLQKDGTLLAIQSSKEKGALGSRIVERTPDKLVLKGAALQGTLFRLDAKTEPNALLDRLREQGAIKVRALPSALGCNQLGLALSAMRALPAEKKPVMLRASDQGLAYHKGPPAASDGGRVEKIVYALQQDQLEWMAIHLSDAAFAPPGPAARIEAALGPPLHRAATGKGDKRQNILMWKAYCESLKGQFNKDIDVTLFETPGKKTGYYYLSEGLIAATWTGLLELANDPAAQEDSDKDDSASKKGSDKKGAPPATSAAPAAAPASPPAAAPKASAPPAPAPTAAAPSPKPTPATPVVAAAPPALATPTAAPKAGTATTATVAKGTSAGPGAAVPSHVGPGTSGGPGGKAQALPLSRPEDTDAPAARPSLPGDERDI